VRRNDELRRSFFASSLLFLSPQKALNVSTEAGEDRRTIIAWFGAKLRLYGVKNNGRSHETGGRQEEH
jgi:hypothetical protein